MEKITNLGHERTRRIEAITQPIQEVVNQHLELLHDDLFLIWEKNDNLQEFEFYLGKYPETSLQSRQKALYEILFILQKDVEPELAGYTFSRSAGGIKLLRNPN